MTSSCQLQDLIVRLMGGDKIPPDQARKFPGPLWCLRFSVAYALCGRLVSFPRGPEISALCASWLSSELGLSLVQILMAAPLPSGLLTDPHQAAPASQRSGCLHAPFSDCSLLPICKTLTGIIAITKFLSI